MATSPATDPARNDCGERVESRQRGRALVRTLDGCSSARARRRTSSRSTSARTPTASPQHMCARTSLGVAECGIERRGHSVEVKAIGSPRDSVAPDVGPGGSLHSQRSPHARPAPAPITTWWDRSRGRRGGSRSITSHCRAPTLAASQVADDLDGDGLYDNQLGEVIATLDGDHLGTSHGDDLIGAGVIASSIELQATRSSGRRTRRGDLLRSGRRRRDDDGRDDRRQHVRFQPDAHDPRAGQGDPGVAGVCGCRSDYRRARRDGARSRA